MSNERLAMLFFDIGLVLAMISMVIGPFEITNWALTTGVVACFFGIASLCLGFLSWDDWMRPDHSDGMPPRKPSDQGTAEPDTVNGQNDPSVHSL